MCSSPWVPSEWIKAHCFEPRTACSLALETVSAVPEGVCSFAQRLKDFSSLRPDAVLILTTACDQMRRAADSAMSAHNVFLFNLPATWQTCAPRRLYHHELDRLGRFLEQLGGRRPTPEELELILLQWDRRRRQVHQLLPRLSPRQAAEALMNFFQGGDVRCGIQPAMSKGIPIALVGGPLLRSQLTIFDAIESVGAQVVLNATEPGERCLLPPLPPRSAGQTPLAFLADHYFDHCVDVFHRPNSRLYAWLATRLAERRVRGIVMCVHVGCDLWRAEAASLREAFGLPLLILDEHEAQSVGPRELTRLGAFVESLQ